MMFALSQNDVASTPTARAGLGLHRPSSRSLEDGAAVAASPDKIIQVERLQLSAFGAPRTVRLATRSWAQADLRARWQAYPRGIGTAPSYVGTCARIRALAARRNGTSPESLMRGAP